MLRYSVFILGVALGLVSTASAWVKIPTVKKVDCNSIEGAAASGYDECIWVQKNNGDRYAGLHFFKGKSHIKNGTLLNEDGTPDFDAPVAVTDDLVSALGFVYMSLSDYPSSTQFTALYVQIDTGVGHILGIHRVDLNALAKNAPPHLHYHQDIKAAPPRTPVSKKGYQLKHQIVVDLNFVEHVGNVEENLDKLLVHAMVYYKQPSLLTKIQLMTNPDPIYVQERWVAGGDNLQAFSRAIKENPDWPDADAYSLLSFDDGTMYGLLGLGNVQCVCHPDRSLKASIVEYLGNELDTAIAMVHEIGHNLGMAHDFDLNPDLTEKNRYASNKEKCTDEGGIMDYNQEYSRWTQCSNDDFQAYFDNHQPYCLLEIGALPTTTPPPTTTPKPTIPTGPCVDYWTNCHEQRRLCNNDWTVTEHCLQTCMYCPNGPTTCYDQWPTDYCEDRVNIGLCGIVSEALNCRKTCKLCQ